MSLRDRIERRSANLMQPGSAPWKNLRCAPARSRFCRAKTVRKSASSNSHFGALPHECGAPAGFGTPPRARGGSEAPKRAWPGRPSQNENCWIGMTWGWTPSSPSGIIRPY